MQIKIKVGSETTSGEFNAIGVLFGALALNKHQETIAQPITPAAVIAPVTVNAPMPEVASAPIAQPTPEPVAVEQAITAAVAQPEAPKRRRRTKAEIEADEKLAKENSEVAEAESVAEQNNAEALALAEEAPAADPVEEAPAPAAEEFVDTNTGEITSTRTYLEAEVQTLASVTARSKGAQVVKDKIASLGKARIADLDADQLNALGAFLESLK